MAVKAAKAAWDDLAFHTSKEIQEVVQETVLPFLDTNLFSTRSNH